eukprot:7292107-Prymnesium_polylepis.1
MRYPRDTPRRNLLCSDFRSNKLTLSLNPQHPQFGKGGLSCAETTPTPPKKRPPGVRGHQRPPAPPPPQPARSPAAP